MIFFSYSVANLKHLMQKGFLFEYLFENNKGENQFIKVPLQCRYKNLQYSKFENSAVFIKDKN